MSKWAISTFNFNNTLTEKSSGKVHKFSDSNIIKESNMNSDGDGHFEQVGADGTCEDLD